jgi:hypothetical protein
MRDPDQCMQLQERRNSSACVNGGSESVMVDVHTWGSPNDLREYRMEVSALCKKVGRAAGRCK